MTTPRNPVSGDLLGASGGPVNVVTLLGGGTPVSDRVYPPLDPRSGLVLGEDGKAYDLTELLAQGGTMEELPEPSADCAGRIVQYSGPTTDDLTHGHFYECVASEEDAYAWVEISLAPGGGGLTAEVVGTLLVLT